MNPWRWRARHALLAALCVGGCVGVGARNPGRPVPRPAPPPRDTVGPLRIRVVYPRLVDTVPLPRAEDPILARDSSFILGSVGRGDATLTVNGHDVPVYPNGAWIAWIPLPDDSLARFDLRARVADQADRFTFDARLPARFEPPVTGPWVDSTSFAPTGSRWVRAGEGLRLAVRAAAGAAVSLLLPDSTRIPLVPAAAPAEVPWGERAFGTERPAVDDPLRDRYVVWWTGPLGPDPGPVMDPAEVVDDSAAWAWLQVVLGGDTARARWPLRVGVLAEGAMPVAIVDDDTAGTGLTDRTLAGRPSPYGTYHWFFPNGTRAVVSGRWNDRIRLQLSARTAAWVDAGDVQRLPAGTPPVRGTTAPFRLHPGERSATLRVPLPGRAPFRVAEDERRLTLTVYGVAANANWIQYGGTDPFVRLIAFEAPAADETVITVDLASRVWGYRWRWEGNDLLLEIRRPPHIDARHPLRGRFVVLDPGHPPGGARGPSGVYEGDVVLAVVRKAAQLLEARGARVRQMRTDTLPVSLVARTEGAQAADADLLVSVHANALPDGVNPFVNNGTSVYYYHPRSAPLARAIDRALVRRLGFPDLGVGRGDLALARPTWMPAVLAEGLFLMLPDQEAVLASDAGQWRYARGLVDGIEAFLRERAANP